jgi:hypothetical protein
MSISFGARITHPEPLSAVLMHAERYVASVPHSPFVVETGEASAIVIGPFQVLDAPGTIDPTRKYKEAFSGWELGDVLISTGSLAKSSLTVCYRARIDELELGEYEPTQADKAESLATAGYGVSIGAYRDKASFALASLLVCAVAERNGTRILDEGNDLLRLGRQASRCSQMPSAARSILRRAGPTR